MKLFCRHCWKKENVRLIIKEPHVSAYGEYCGNWIKHLNSAERTQALIEGTSVHENKELQRQLSQRTA